MEFALITPLLFLLIFGIIQFGIFFAQDVALSNAARQGARAGAVPGDTATPLGTCQVIYDEVQQGVQTIALDVSAVEIEVRLSTEAAGTNRCPPTPGTPSVPAVPADEPCADVTSGDELYVEASYDARLAIPIFGNEVINLNREGLYRCEFS